MWFGRATDSERSREAEDLLQAGFWFALSLTHHTHDAEDLTQQAWLNLARRHGRVRGKGLLFQTIRNLFYDQYRRGKIVVFEPLEDEHAEQPAADGDDSAPVSTKRGARCASGRDRKRT